MRYLIPASLALSASLAFSVPATAADYTLPSKREKRTYSALWHAVRHDHGKRTPGRNIRRWGIQTDSGRIRPASATEMSRSIHQLRMFRLPLLRGGPPAMAPSGVSTPHAGGTLSAIAACESGGNPATNTGNGFYGKYQFDLGTWGSVGGSGLPSNASEAEQDMRAAMLYQRRGAAPWPVCGR